MCMNNFQVSVQNASLDFYFFYIKFAASKKKFRNHWRRQTSAGTQRQLSYIFSEKIHNFNIFLGIKFGTNKVGEFSS